MADLDVEKKKNNDWWKWLLGIIALIIIVWVILENVDGDDEVEEADTTAHVKLSPETEKDKSTYAVKF